MEGLELFEESANLHLRRGADVARMVFRPVAQGAHDSRAGHRGPACMLSGAPLTSAVHCGWSMPHAHVLRRR